MVAGFVLLLILLLLIVPIVGLVIYLTSRNKNDRG